MSLEREFLESLYKNTMCIQVGTRHSGKTTWACCLLRHLMLNDRFLLRRKMHEHCIELSVIFAKNAAEQIDAVEFVLIGCCRVDLNKPETFSSGADEIL